MTEAEWVEVWQDRIAGLALRGLVLDTDRRADGPFTAGQYALAVPEKVKKLLVQMYRTIPEAAPRPERDGTVNPEAGMTAKQRITKWQREADELLAELRDEHLHGGVKAAHMTARRRNMRKMIAMHQETCGHGSGCRAELSMKAALLIEILISIAVANGE